MHNHCRRGSKYSPLQASAQRAFGRDYEEEFHSKEMSSFFYPRHGLLLSKSGMIHVGRIIQDVTLTCHGSQVQRSIVCQQSKISLIGIQFVLYITFCMRSDTTSGRPHQRHMILCCHDSLLMDVLMTSARWRRPHQ